MEGAVLVWLLCLQGSLLVNTLDCADKGTWRQTEEYRRECVGGDATRTLPAELMEQKSLAPSGALREPDLGKLPSRPKRQLERERSQSKKVYYPGNTSVTGHPMRLMLTERSRRHLPAIKTKPKRKSRIGSFSLLSHKQPKSLQVTRARRQLQNDKKKRKKGPGQYSALGDIQFFSIGDRNSQEELPTKEEKR